MNKTDLEREWRQLAPAWTAEMRQGRNPARRGLLDPAAIRACGDVRGRKVLDCGCGEGRFSRVLLECGAAHVLGLDLCEPMIAAAKQLANGQDDYRVADVEDLSFLGDGSFDVAVSYLNQCDLPAIESNTREVFRVLKPGGRFVVVTNHRLEGGGYGNGL